MLNMQTYHHDENAPIKKIVILLHGYGANGQDLLDLARAWAPHCPQTLFVSPDAPFPCEAGGGGFQWFSLQEFTPQSMEEGAMKAYPPLKEFIEDVRKTYSVDEIVLVGFSQGTMMSLYYALRHTDHISGVLGYSGALLGATCPILDTQKNFPISLIHGVDDPIIPVQAAEQAYTHLKERGCDVQKTIIPALAHGINQEGLERGLSFLKSI